MKIGPVGAELFHADGQTVITKLIGTFRKFAKAPKIVRVFLLIQATQYTLYCGCIFAECSNKRFNAAPKAPPT
jgi:hypothetical protein